MNLKLIIKIICFCFCSLWIPLAFSYNINKVPFVGEEKSQPQPLTDSNLPAGVQKASKGVVSICAIASENLVPHNPSVNIFMLGTAFYITKNIVATNLNILMDLLFLELYNIEDLYFCQHSGGGQYSPLESKPIKFLGTAPLDDLVLLETNDDNKDSPELPLSPDQTPDLTGTYYLLSGDRVYVKLRNLKIFENDYLMITPTLYLGGFNGGPILNEKGQVVSVFSGFHVNDARSAPARFLNSLIDKVSKKKKVQDDDVLHTEIKHIKTLAEQGYAPAQLNILFADLVRDYSKTKKKRMLQTLLDDKNTLASLLAGVRTMKTQHQNTEENTKAFQYLKTAVESNIWGIGAHILVAVWCLENGAFDSNYNHDLLNQVKKHLIPKIRHNLSEHNYMISPFYIENYCGTPTIPYMPQLYNKDTAKKEVTL